MNEETKEEVKEAEVDVLHIVNENGFLGPRIPAVTALGDAVTPTINDKALSGLKVVGDEADVELGCAFIFPSVSDLQTANDHILELGMPQNKVAAYVYSKFALEYNQVLSKYPWRNSKPNGLLRAIDDVGVVLRDPRNELYKCATIETDVNALYAGAIDGAKLHRSAMDYLRVYQGLGIGRDFDKGDTVNLRILLGDKGAEDSPYKYSYVKDIMRSLHAWHVALTLRYAVLVGLVFKPDGTVEVVLAEPRIQDDGQIVSWTYKLMKANKYFTLLYGAADTRQLVNRLKLIAVKSNTHLCVTQEEWYWAYSKGPHSCMTDFSYENSPVRAYAALDVMGRDNNLRLFIMYKGELLGEDTEVTARAIVNIGTDKYVRAYGYNADEILQANGYEQDDYCLDDCHLAAVDTYDGSSFARPYLDGDVCYCDYDEADGTFLIGGSDIDFCDACGYLDKDEVGGRRYSCGLCDDDFNTDGDPEIALFDSDGDYSWITVCPSCMEDLTKLDEFIYNSYAYARSCDCVGTEDGRCVLWQDAVECEVDNYIYSLYSEEVVQVQGYYVQHGYTEDGPDGLILTADAAETLGVDYLGEEAND